MYNRYILIVYVIAILMNKIKEKISIHIKNNTCNDITNIDKKNNNVWLKQQ